MGSAARQYLLPDLPFSLDITLIGAHFMFGYILTSCVATRVRLLTLCIAACRDHIAAPLPRR